MGSRRRGDEPEGRKQGFRPGSMHYERAALLRGAYRVDVRQESEEKIGKSAEE